MFATDAGLREDCMKIPLWFGVPLLAMATSGLVGASDLSPCDQHPTRTGWHVFVDHEDRFCFEYPPKYQVAPAVVAPGFTTGLATRFIGRLTTNPSPSEGAIDEKAATINISAFGIPFRPKDLAKFAHMGQEEFPPQRIHAAHGDFYSYGGGGGGVDYPDDFFFGLRGRRFSIEFVGPYSGEKTPDPETKRIEPEVLASFHSF